MTQTVPVNRAQLRALKKQQQRRPAAPQRHAVSAHRIVREAGIFGQITRFLDQLATGEVLCAGGKPIFTADDGHQYVAAPAIAGWVELWERVAAKYQLQMSVRHLAQLGRYLENNVPITAQLIASARQEIEDCRAHYRRLPLDLIRSEVTTQLIAQQFENLGIKP